MPSWTLSVNPATDTGLEPVDVVVEAVPEATVLDLAQALGSHLAPERDGLLVAPVGSGRPWPASRRLSECALRSGDLIDVTTVGSAWVARPEPTTTTRGLLRVVAGPDAGRTERLATPSVVVGRAREATVRLSDPLVSGRHVRITFGPRPGSGAPLVTVADEGSANGTVVDGHRISRATVIEPGTPFVIGGSTLVVEPAPTSRAGSAGIAGSAGSAAGDPASSAGGSDAVAVYRSPRFGEPLVEEVLDVPSPPQRQRPSPLPWTMMVLPAVMGLAMFGTGRGAYSLVYALIWPLMGFGGWWQQRRANEKDFQRELAAWRRNVDRTVARISEQRGLQHDRAVGDHPDVADLPVRVANHDGTLWSRQPDGPDFMAVRVGRGPVPALLTGRMRDGGDEEVLDATRTELAALATIPDTPVLAPLAGSSLVALTGDDGEVDAAVRALVVRLALDHSPADLTVAAVLGHRRAHHETWLRWLPHAGPRAGGEPAVAIGATDGQALLDRLTSEDGGRGHTVCLVDAGAGIQRRAVEAAAARAADLRLHLVWLGDHPHTVPAATQQLVDLRARTVAGRDRSGLQRLDTADHTDLGQAWRAARLITNRVDEAAVLPAESALPTAVRLPDVVSDLRDLDDVEAILRRWATSTGLRAQLGAGVDGVVTLDLREDGPHGLVAGTTGSGKSELLQTLICSLAANTPPSRITFLLVDYKGGAAFRECADLPHTIGYITDLTPALVQRALTSLGAEITRREELLGEFGVKDLIQLEREHPHVAPPALLICVDEFAALTAEVPEFVEGMVNLAQRGRSLGMHLILATQRPAGVVTPAIRANTDLRIALRVGAVDDSRDVIDAPDAARISRRTPGRAWVRRTGHGTAELVQAAWVGAREPVDAATARVDVRAFAATRRPEREAAEVHVDGRTDLDRIVATINAAHTSLGVPAPRRPWLPPLPAELELDPAETVDTAARLAPAQVVIGRLDDPQRQTQPELVLDYAAAGHVLVHGASGSGKTELLRTLAVSLSLADAHRPGAVAPYVYGLDFAGGGLMALEALPTVGAVIPEQQLSRALRLIRVLRATVEDRSNALTATGATDLESLAALGHVLPRVHLLVDNLPSLMDALESGGAVKRSHSEMLTTILQNGRRVGVHVTATAPGRNGGPSATVASFGRRVVLRLTNPDDYMMLGVPNTLLTPDSAPGSVLIGRQVGQVATIGGSGTPLQNERIAAAAAFVESAVGERPRGTIPAMPTTVPAEAVPAAEGTTVTVGVDADTITPVRADLANGPTLVVGRSRSGRTSVLHGLSAAHTTGYAAELAPEGAAASQPGEDLVQTGSGDADRSDGCEPVDVVQTGAGGANRIAYLAPAGARVPSGLSPAAYSSVVEVTTWITRREKGARGLLLIDDAHLVERDASSAELLELVGALDAATRDGLAVVAAADTDELRSRTGGGALLGWLRRARQGLILQPDGLDGTVLGITVPNQSVEVMTGPGRGLWCQDGTAVLVQAVVDLGGAS